MIQSWRKRVPEDFEFTVRCNRELTRRLQYESLDDALEVVERLKEICSVLKANILHVQTPSTFKFNKMMIKKLNAFLSSTNLSNLRLAWEVRGGSVSERQRLFSLLEKHNVIHCVDLSRESPAYESDILYSRLFGKGIHNIYQFTDSELEEIDEKVKAGKVETAYLNFHGVRMYKDATRVHIYEATGKSPKITHSVGVNSIIEVLKEDAKFPSTISALINHQDWKVCEWSDDEQLRLSEVLRRVEEKRFDNLLELEAKLYQLKRV